MKSVAKHPGTPEDAAKLPPYGDGARAKLLERFLAS